MSLVWAILLRNESHKLSNNFTTKLTIAKNYTTFTFKALFGLNPTVKVKPIEQRSQFQQI